MQVFGWRSYQGTYEDSATVLPVALKRVVDALSQADEEEVLAILYDDVLPHLRGGVEVQSLVIPTIAFFSSAHQANESLAEHALGALFHLYALDIRRGCSILTPPAFFGFREEGTSSIGFDALKSYGKMVMDSLPPEQQCFYASCLWPNASTAAFLRDQLLRHLDHSSVMKNASVGLGVLAHFGSVALSDLRGLPVSDPNYRLVMLALGGDRLAASHLASAVLPEEDSELLWAQSFAGVAADVAIACAEVSIIHLEHCFRRIADLRKFAQNRGYELEFDAYKQLNEDLAHIYFSAPHGPVDDLLERFNLANLQSHELLRQGTVLPSALALGSKQQPQRVRVYDYEVTTG